MAPFERPSSAAPSGGRHRVAAAAAAALLLTSLSSHNSAALAFSHRRTSATTSRAATRGGGGVSPPEAVAAAALSRRPTSPFRAASGWRGDGISVLGLGGGARHHDEAPLTKFCPPGTFRPSPSALRSKPRRYDIDLTALPYDSSDEDGGSSAGGNDPAKEQPPASIRRDLQGIVTLVGAQALLLPISALIARALHLPNNGLGAGFEWTSLAFVEGLRWTLPLFAVAGIMRLIEPHSEALQDVTRATQRSVLAVMGRRRRPAFALLVSILLGTVAGWGEEWLFRGVFQTMLSGWLSSDALALAISGAVFGLLHAVTPVYALLAGAASVFFGYLYNETQNLAVPMACHAVYDIGALMWAHCSVTALTPEEQDEIIEGGGPGAPIMDAGALDK